MKTKRIFFDGTPLTGHISGVGRVLLDTLEALDDEKFAQKYEIYVFLPFNEMKKIRAKFHYKFIKIKSLPFPHKFLGLFSRLKFAPPLDVFLGKGVYIFENYRNWNLWFSRSITYFHDVCFLRHPEFISKLNLKFLQKYSKIWLARTDKIATVSKSSKIDIEKYLKIKDVCVVPNAVNTNFFKPKNTREVAEMRAKWNLPENYYFFLGNIEPRKNLQNLVEAFAKFTEKNRNNALFLAGGDGWNNEKIYAAINTTKKSGAKIIKNQKFVPDEDLPALFSGARALILPSWYEGSSVPVLQALACGAPVIASDIPPVREVARGHEKNIIFVNPANQNEIVAALSNIKKIKHENSPKNLPSWKNSVEKLLEIADKLFEKL